MRAPALLLRSETGEAMVALDLGDFALTDREELFPRFLDFPMETRMILGAASLVASADRVLLQSAGQVELYRLPEEAREHRAASTREFEEELLPALAAKGRARGEGLRALAPSLEGSQALRGWLAHWGLRLAAQLEVAADECEKFLWKIILMLQVSRKAGRSEMLGGWGLVCEKLGERWTLSYDSLATHADLGRLIEEFDHTFSTRVFAGDARAHEGWLERLEETSLIEQLRAELLMQAQAKFEAENVAWLFTRMEREQEGWRREVGGVAPIRKRFASEGWAVLKPLECDAGRHGLAAVLRDFERLAEFWSDYNVYAKGREPRTPEELFSQPDLFHPPPRGVSPLNQLDDGINFLFSETLHVVGVAPDEEFGVGLVLLLKALSLVRRFDWPFFGVDTLDRVWEATTD